MSSNTTLKTLSQVILILCTAGMTFSAYINYLTPLSIQTYIVAENCAQNGTPSCCSHCLGLPVFEYGLAVGAASFSSVVFVFFSGAVIDLVGLPTAAVILVSVLLFGSLALAVAPYMTRYHGLVISAFGINRLCIECTVLWSLTLTQYIGIRYFEPKWQSFAISVAYAAGSFGGLLGTFFGARIASSFGVHFVFWGDVLAVVLPICSAIGLILMFRYSSDVISFENRKRQETEKELKVTALTFIAQSLKAFSFEYWLIAFILSLTFASTLVYIANAPIIQTGLFHLSSVKIAQNLSYQWIIKIFLTPLLGYLLSTIPVHLFVAFTGLLVQGVMLIVQIIPHGSSLVSSVLSDMPYSVLFVSLSPFFETTTPMSALGLASTIAHAMDLIFTGIFSMIAGAILKNENTRAGALNTIYFLLGILGVEYLLFAILSMELKCACHPKNREENQKLLESK